MSVSTVISVEDLSFYYEKERYIFQNVNFDLQSGDILQILGANGSGKTTLINCLVRQLDPIGGTILINEDDLRRLPRNELSRRIAYVPQIQNNTCTFKIRDYVVTGRTPHLGFLRSPSEDDYQLVDQTLERLGISHLADKSLQQVSGGERQQAQIARALVQDCRIIFFDEPTNHLDYGNQHRVLDMIRGLSYDGYTVILTTHIPDAPLLTGGKVGIFSSEGFVFGDAEKMIDAKVLSKVYNVDIDVFYVDQIDRKACFCRMTKRKSASNENVDVDE